MSAWGHDFRPDYLRIGDVLERLGSPPVVALTATAAPPVRAEIVERLRMRAPRQVITGFDRPNLHLAVRALHRGPPQGGGGRSTRSPGWPAPASSTPPPARTPSGTPRSWPSGAAAPGRTTRASRPRERDEVHEGFLSGDVEVVVATSAFGMGIDKPDVRFVVHADVSESLDSYYQEIGRAGRDGDPAEVAAPLPLRGPRAAQLLRLRRRRPRHAHQRRGRRPGAHPPRGRGRAVGAEGGAAPLAHPPDERRQPAGAGGGARGRRRRPAALRASATRTSATPSAPRRRWRSRTCGWTARGSR